MARPIGNTPVLEGKEAEDFLKKYFPDYKVTEDPFEKTYIYEEEQELKTITESSSVKMELSEETGENRQDLLNLMLLAMELQDEKTLITSMEQYIRRKHISDVLFLPVEWGIEENDYWHRFGKTLFAD